MRDWAEENSKTGRGQTEQVRELNVRICLVEKKSDPLDCCQKYLYQELRGEGQKDSWKICQTQLDRWKSKWTAATEPKSYSIILQMRSHEEFYKMTATTEKNNESGNIYAHKHSLGGMSKLIKERKSKKIWELVKRDEINWTVLIDTW